MAQPWISVQKLAVVPTFNRQFDTSPPPSDWDSLIMRRVLYDPDPSSGVDRSLRSYLGAISYGRATLDAKLFPHAYSDGLGVVEAAWQSLPSAHGYPYVLCVIPRYDGDVNRKGWFTTVNQNGVTAVSRVAMYDGVPTQKQRQRTGVWAMEVLHAIVGLPDLYPTGGNPYPNPPMGDYDNMTYCTGTHDCSYLKQAAGWLAESDFIGHSGLKRDYTLHAIGISRPPPGRVAAVRIPSRTSSETFIVEARLKSDMYEKGFAPLTNGVLEFHGLPDEGVIVYEVTSTAHLEQVKLVSALGVGQTYANTAEGFTVKPTAIIDGGMIVHITRTALPRCADILQEIAEIDEDIANEEDPNKLKQLRAQKNQLRDEAQHLGCF
jgi:hypothetical protein